MHKAGSILIYNKKHGKYYFDQYEGIFKFGFTPKFVKANPDWFEEVKEQKEKPLPIYDESCKKCEKYSKCKGMQITFTDIVCPEK